MWSTNGIIQPIFVVLAIRNFFFFKQFGKAHRGPV